MAPHARLLSPDDYDLWLPAVTPEAFGSLEPGAFPAMRSQLLLAVQAGRLEVVEVASPGARPVHVVVSRPAPGHRTLILGLGAPGPADIQAAAAWAMGCSEMVTVAEEAGAGWTDAAVAAGLTPFVHQIFANPLANSLDLVQTEAQSETLRPWREEQLEPLVALVAQANAGTLPGLMLTLPEVPTRAAIAAHMRSQAAPGGPLLREHSFLWEEDGRLDGVIWLTSGEGGPTLYELVVHPRARGRGIGRRLVRGAQRSLMAAGCPEMLFHTTDSNSPVHRIYRPEEVVLREARRCAYWLSPVLPPPASREGEPVDAPPA